MSRSRSRRPKHLAPQLVHLIAAAEKYVAEHGDKDPRRAEIQSAAHALRALGALALWALPVHGTFVPNNDEVSTIVEGVARTHLGLAKASSDLRAALSSVDAMAARDPIESAQNYVRAVSEEAYFYAGLAFGLTLQDRGCAS